MKVAIAACSMILVARVALAGNAQCWGSIPGELARPDVSCAELSERFLLSMRGLTRDQVVAAMGVPGVAAEHGGLHFLSNYAGGSRGFSGDVNFFFGSDGRVSIITGLIDEASGPEGIELIWNADGFLCSDFPGSRRRCND
jgi:hypothetical protein